MAKRNSLALICFIILALATYFLAVSMETHKKDLAGMKHEGYEVKIESERDFLEHMIPHHQEAVETAQVVLEKGGTLRPLRDLAESIKVNQNAEIDDMKSWYSSWYDVSYEDTGDYLPMMRDLSELSGSELDKVFLEDMIGHHEAAVVISKKVLELSINQEMANLATKIISAQQYEIVMMKDLLKLLPQ